MVGYRGDDLDLRTPQSHPERVDVGNWRDADNGTRGRAHHGGALNGPIVVDETVLACCNHAFDVALAHGAGEVRLEHLLHALTRIDAAAEALEQRGVRVASLRRDIATVIASEIPVSSKSTGSPRRSQEFEDVLRLAASNASRRDEAVNIDDVIHIILDEEPDLPGLALLTRRGSGRRASFDTLPSVPSRPNYLNDASRSSRYRVPAQPSYLHENGNGHNTGRVDGLEHAINNLIGDISSDRKSIAGAMQELQREVLTQRDEMIDGFNALNQSIQSSRSGSVDLTPLNERVVSIGRETGSKLQALEAFMDRLQRNQPSVNVDLGPLSKRLEAIEDVITARSEDHSAQVADRLAKLEDGLGKAQSRATEQHDGVLRELTQVTSRINGALVPLAERIERQRGEVATAILTPLAERMDRQRGEVVSAILSPLAERITRLEKLNQADDTRDTQANQAIVALGERLTRIEQALASWGEQVAQANAAHNKELGEVEEVLVKLNAGQIKLNEGQHSASGALTAWRQEGSSILGTLLGRVETVEQQNARTAGMLEQISLLVERMHHVTAQRYLKRNRMKYWLFGTDDWISASWPSQASKLREAVDRVKSARA